jgi:hypothetical protein
MSSSMLGNSGLRGATGGMAGQKGNKLAGYNVNQLQNFTPEQMQLFQQMFSHVGPQSYTGRLAGGDESLFQEMEAPAMRQFGALQGNLASRFSGMGMGARRGSGFQNTMNQASSDFAQDLQSRRQELQRQAIQDLMGMGSSLLGQRSFENVLTPKKKPFWQEILGSLAGGAGEAGGSAGGLGILKLLGLL